MSATGSSRERHAQPGVSGALATLVVLVLGLVVSVGLAVQASMSAGDAFELVAVAAGAALAVSAVGWLVLRALRRQPIGVQALAVALTALARDRGRRGGGGRGDVPLRRRPARRCWWWWS